MPSFDSARGRFRLADRHISTLAYLLDGETPPTELFHSLGELQQIGLVGAEGELSPLLRDLVSTLAEPVVALQVETTGGEGTLQHGVVVGKETALSHDGWPGSDESEYFSTDARFLVWELARKVNLRMDDSKVPAEPEISTSLGVVDVAFTALESAHGSEEEIKSAVRTAISEGSDLADATRDQLGDLVGSLRSMWRITSVWDEPRDGGTPATSRSLSVWDCGDIGYWIRQEPREVLSSASVDSSSPLRIAHAQPGEIWEQIVGLLPDKDELAVQSA